MGHSRYKLLLQNHLCINDNQKPRQTFWDTCFISHFDCSLLMNKDTKKTDFVQVVHGECQEYIH